MGGDNLGGNEGGLGLLGIWVSLSWASKIKRDGMEGKNNSTITKYPQTQFRNTSNFDPNSGITKWELFDMEHSFLIVTLWLPIINPPLSYLIIVSHISHGVSVRNFL